MLRSITKWSKQIDNSSISSKKDQIDPKLIKSAYFRYIFGIFWLNQPMFDLFWHFSHCFNGFCHDDSDSDNKFGSTILIYSKGLKLERPKLKHHPYFGLIFFENEAF